MNPTMQRLLPFLVGEIFETETKQYFKQIYQLIDENEKILGIWTTGFNHLGTNYRKGNMVARDCPTLSLALVPRMSQLLQLQKLVGYDRQQVTQALIKLLQSCDTLQDARDTLPDCVVVLYAPFSTMARTRPEAWTVDGSPWDLRLYQKTLTKIHTYCAMKFIY